MAIGMKEAIDAMDYEELMRLKIDLEAGSFSMKKMVRQKITEMEKKHEKRCAVCSSEMDGYRTSNYTLLFGPEDFKKKASFCGIDCLEYFIEKLKDMQHFSKQGRRVPENENLE